jgi:hypothetical protein
LAEEVAGATLPPTIKTDSAVDLAGALALILLEQITLAALGLQAKGLPVATQISLNQRDLLLAAAAVLVLLVETRAIKLEASAALECLTLLTDLHFTGRAAGDLARKGLQVCREMVALEEVAGEQTRLVAHLPALAEALH